MSNEESITSIKPDNNSGNSSDLPAVPALDIAPEDRALLEDLKNLAIKRTFDVNKLSPKVTKRVLFLKDIQVKHNELEEKFLEEKAALEATYDDFYKPLFAKRYEIVNGVVEAESEKGVPNFWLIAMKTNEMLANEITERDEGALKYLKDIRSCRVENNSRNFKLEFLFDSNPYFKNSVLSKIYHVTDEDGPVLEKVIGTDIEWCPGKCLTHKVVVKKKAKKGSRKVNNIPMTKTENSESFFNFFKPPEIPEIDEVDDYDDFDTDMTEELQNLMDQDYDIAVTIRDKLIPHAVSWFTGEALVDEDDYDDDEYDEKSD
ncbi:Nucleosome assembly protein 1,4 [Cardamine amara subsp. amara]|uniref:Nucleosome assembly protein 1,4 n=1 Tax=Cardamine amara subsp. amara TaxID=228776 RepID=A0ABD1AZ78_CARAN